MFITSVGGEIRWPCFSGWSETKFANIFAEFVNSEVQIIFPAPLDRADNDGLNLFRGVDVGRPPASFFALGMKTPCSIRTVHYGELPGVLVRHLVAVHFQCNDSPCPLDQLAVFLDRVQI